MVRDWAKALSSGDDATAIDLIDRGVVVRGMLPSEYDDRLERTPLHLAAAYGRLAVVEVLLARGDDPNALDRQGKPPLFDAMVSGCRVSASDRRRIVDRLIAAGASLDRFTPRGHTLHFACEAGFTDLVRRLLEGGLPVDLRAPEGARAPLHHGATHHSIVELLLGAGATPTPTGCEESPLGVAFLAKADDCVDLLEAAGARLLAGELGEIVAKAAESGRVRLERALRLGAPIDAPGEDRQTALHLAVWELDAERVRLLLELGANVNARSEDGTTPLDLLDQVDEDDGIEPIRALLEHAGAAAEHGAEAADEEPVDADPIFDLARLGPTEELEALLDDGLSPHFRYDGEPLIHGAVDFHLHDGSDERTKLLLARGANVDDRSDLGWTPLMHAAALAHCTDFGRAEPMLGHVIPEVIEILLAAGARLDVTSGAGTTMLHAACLGGLPDLARRAVKAGFAPGVTNQFLRTPLHEAARGGHLELVGWLCDSGVDPAPRDVSGSTPLHLATRALKADIVAYLIEKGVPIDLRDYAGQTALAIACQVGLHSVVPELLARGADPKTRDIFHLTPLHRACESSTDRYQALLIAFTPTEELAEIEERVDKVAVEGAKLLLDAGADVNARDLDGRTPLHVVASQGNVLGGKPSIAMTKLLLEAGAVP